MSAREKTMNTKPVIEQKAQRTWMATLDAFLDWFERHKTGVIGTLLLHTLALFMLTVWSIRATPREEDRSEMRIEVVSDEQAEEMLERIDRELAGIPESVTNLTSNIEAELAKPGYSPQRLAERVENDLRAMEQAEFDRLAEERREKGEEVSIPELDPSKWDKEQYMDKAAEPVKVEGATTVWHDLKAPLRAERFIHVPAYICKNFGLVVVNVTVDRQGQVRKAELDAGRTNTDDDCMVQSALNSARRASFAPDASAPDRQQGAIYYRFLPQ